MFREMRRKNCELSSETAEKILREGIFGVLSLVGDGGYGYGVPINYAVENKKIYFHSATEGHKIDAIKNNDKVSFCVVDKHEIVGKEFTSYFTSVIAFGKIKIISDNSNSELRRGLELLSEKYCSEIPADRREKYIEGSLKSERVFVMVLEIEHLTGKAARELVRDGEIS